MTKERDHPFMKAHRQAAGVPESPQLEGMMNATNGLCNMAQSYFVSDANKHDLLVLCTSIKVLIQREAGILTEDEAASTE